MGVQIIGAPDQCGHKIIKGPFPLGEGFRERFHIDQRDHIYRLPTTIYQLRSPWSIAEWDQLLAFSFQLSAFIYHLPLAAEKRLFLPLLTD
jgi:hypothetical protein